MLFCHKFLHPLHSKGQWDLNSNTVVCSTIFKDDSHSGCWKLKCMKSNEGPSFKYVHVNGGVCHFVLNCTEREGGAAKLYMI